MIGIYHNRDLDGYTSGAIIKMKYPDATLVGYDYGKPFDLDQINGPVIMADVSMPMETMLEIAKRSGWNFTWIDHHISAIKEYNEFIGQGESFLNAVLDNTISACEACWKHLFKGQEIPEGIRLLGEYDTWRNQDAVKWENRILPYQFGMRLLCNSPESFPWNLVVGAFGIGGTGHLTEELVSKGKTVLEYQRQQNSVACRSAFECEFECLRAICLNGGGFNSDVFKSVYDESKHDIMMPFMFNGKFWVVSLYTTKDIDCSVIAKKYGGGGHKKASGFQLDDIRKIFSI